MSHNQPATNSLDSWKCYSSWFDNNLYPTLRPCNSYF